MIEVRVQNLSKKFQDIFAKSALNSLNDVSHTFPAGKSTAVMGHNGAGKTTLLRSILGLNLPSKGEVLFNGEPFSFHKHRLGYMPETNRLPLKLTPLELLCGQLRIFRPEYSRAQIHTEAQTYLNKVGLEAQQNKWIEKLSKGQGRRVAWALANIHNPGLIVLDEPFSGFDPKGQEDLWKLMMEAKTQGKTMLISTHELDFAQEFCDEILVLKRGVIALRAKKSGDAVPFFSKADVLAAFAGEG